MGRQVRRVPASWEHPLDEQGKPIPMTGSFPYNADEIAQGLREGWLEGEPPHYGVPVMPDWPEAERTHYQMYEDTTEGTPISPVMASPEELARWLADNKASRWGWEPASYDEWLRVINGGFGGLILQGSSDGK